MYAKKAVATGLLLLTLAFSGCGGADSHDELLNDMLSMLDEYARVLESVSDKASASAAAAELEVIKVEMQFLLARAEKLGRATPEVEQALRQKYKPEFTEVMKRFKSSTAKIAIYPELRDAMKSAASSFQTAPF